jgi:hypothetical protein
MKKIIIGIGGLARSGKDTLCQLLKEELQSNSVSVKRMALADKLKEEIRPALLQEYGIDILDCTPEQKEIVRPKLVAFGKAAREDSKGTHWTTILDENIEKCAEQVIIVPDIRYNYYEEDEVKWVTKKRNGVLCHVRRYFYENGLAKFTSPPNEDEWLNDPSVEVAADFHIIWNTLLDTKQLAAQNNPELKAITSKIYGLINTAG